MKVIEPPDKAWIGLRVKCQGCRTVIEIEPSDGDLIVDYGSFGDKAVKWKCPKCGNSCVAYL